MKLVNYQLQTQMEQLSQEKSTQYFKDYLQSILEDESKPYYTKADYVGLSLQELDNKIHYLTNDIRELQQLKKRLSTALDIAKAITAEVFMENGIERIDGNIISSITLSKPSTKTKTSLTIKDENALLTLGYVKFEVDEQEIEKAMQSEEGIKELEKYVTLETDSIMIPAKAKINTKRVKLETTTEEFPTPIQKAA